MLIEGIGCCGVVLYLLHKKAASMLVLSTCVPLSFLGPCCEELLTKVVAVADTRFIV